LGPSGSTGVEICEGSEGGETDEREDSEDTDEKEDERLDSGESISMGFIILG
jgi:hypothetical protein